MIKPRSSLFAKILCWFFLNLALLVVVLTIFFAFQPQVNLYAVFRQQGSNRIRIASMLISYDVAQVEKDKWSEVLSRHAKINQVDFALVLEDGSYFSSAEKSVPEPVIKKAKEILQIKPPWSGAGLQRLSDQIKSSVAGKNSSSSEIKGVDSFLKDDQITTNPLRYAEAYERKPHLLMRTKVPSRYWVGNRIPLFLKQYQPPTPAMLIAFSDSATGHGFFFDPLPWMIVAAAVIIISVLMWIPMVRNITGPITRMTKATELIAKGRFDVSIHEERADEIGRLANAINHMTSHLADFVKGQRRFLGDVAHELGTPVARINFGLAALEERLESDNRKRVSDIMEDVEEMSQLVNELLAFSRAEISRESVKLEKVNLLTVIQAAIKREVTPSTGVMMEVDPDLHVRASAELLTRAAANIIRNAIKYAVNGSSYPIKIESWCKGDEVYLEISDRGPGVPEELLNRLFEPFFRPEPSRNRASGGVGLGLAIVKSCIETCRGRVSAHNLEPEGFAVTITLSKVNNDNFPIM